MRRDLAQDLKLRLGQDQTVPIRLGLDTLRELGHRDTRLVPAGPPQPARSAAILAAQHGARRLDAAGIDLELLGGRVDLAAETGGQRTQLRLPHRAPVVARRPRHVDPHAAQLGQRHVVGNVDDERTFDPLEQRSYLPELFRGQIAELDIESRARKPRLAVPQAQHDLAVRRVRGNGAGRKHAGRNAGLGKPRHGRDPSIGGATPREPHAMRPRDHARDPGRGLREIGWRVGRLQPVHDTVQALVRAFDAGEEMQDAFVDAKGARGQRIARPHIEKPPVAQRLLPAERAPMRVGQRRERQRESGLAALRVALRRSAELREAAIQLHARAKQKRGAFEAREIETLAQRAERGAFRALLRQCGCVFLAACVSEQRRMHRPERGDEPCLIFFLPCPGRAHGQLTVICGRSWP